jgi:hypothetical protein
MPPLRDTAFETRIEGIAGEEGYKIGLGFVFLAGAVFIHDRNEAWDPSDGFRGAGSGGMTRSALNVFEQGNCLERAITELKN